MKVHALKTWPSYLEAMIEGRKMFEVRKDDRNFKVGDRLHLLGWNPETREYTGREHTVVVTYILGGGAFGLAQGHVIMGLKPFRFDDASQAPRNTSAVERDGVRPEADLSCDSSGAKEGAPSLPSTSSHSGKEE